MSLLCQRASTWVFYDQFFVSLRQESTGHVMGSSVENEVSRSPLKVLFLTSSYPRSREDTASIFLRYLAEELCERGNDIHVLVPADGESNTSVEGRVTVHRFQYLPAPFQKLFYGSGVLPNLKRSPLLWVQVPFFLMAMTYSMLRLVRRERFDLIHAHWLLPQGLIGLLAKYICKLPLITTAHGADAFAFRTKISKALKRLVVEKGDVWTANTVTTAEAILQSPNEPKPRIIPMGVDIQIFSSGKSMTLRRELAENEFLILFVGRLVEKKGCHYLIEAFSLLPPPIQARTRLWIVGDGDQKIALERSANKASIQDRVRFWGTVSNQRLPDFYAASNLFVAPSIEAGSGDTEGLGVVLLEAFAAQASTIATRVGGIGSVITDGVTGLLVEPRDAIALAAAIERLLTDTRLRARLAENAFAKVNEWYSWKKIALDFESVYREVPRSR